MALTNPGAQVPSLLFHTLRLIPYIQEKTRHINRANPDGLTMGDTPIFVMVYTKNGNFEKKKGKDEQIY